MKVIILADGNYPYHSLPLAQLRSGLPVVCCDGAANRFVAEGGIPTAIIGDGDSLSAEVRERYADLIHCVTEQETNDLTKAVTYCIEHKFKHIAILGATGMREDHTLGNISLLANYGKQADVRMYTDYGVFVAVFESTYFQSFAGQQVSIFNLRQENHIDAEGLLYPIKHRNFAQWWEGTLNESTTDSFLLKLKGEVIVFQTYEKKQRD